MKVISRFLIITSCILNLSFNCEAFESKTFLLLGNIQKVTIDVHIYKAQLSRETLSKHDTLAIEVKGLIDNIIDQIQSGESIDLMKNFQDIHASLEELQLYLERDKKNASEPADYYSKAAPMDFVASGALPIPGAIEAVAKAVEAAINYINSLTSFVMKEIQDWQGEKEALKMDRIARLETYKWTLINNV